MDRRRLWWTSAGLLATLGCGSEPIPRVAVTGTTISIAIPPSYPVGFSRAMSNQMIQYLVTNPDSLVTAPLPAPSYSSTSGLEDEARGELVFSLMSGSTFVTYLPVRYITRVHPDENAPAATAVDPGFSGGQAIALLDIPKAVLANSYSIQVDLYRRDPIAVGHAFENLDPQPQLEGEDWIGWGQSPADPHQGIPIQIVAGSAARYNAFTGWAEFFGTLANDEVSDDAKLIVPHPAIRIRLHGESEAAPAAIDLALDYPREKIEILGVQLERADRSSAVALLSPDTGSVSGCSSQSGTVGISVADPEAATAAIQVAYRVRPLDQAGCGLLAAGDVTIPSASVRAYDGSGEEITPATSVGVLNPLAF